MSGKRRTRSDKETELRDALACAVRSMRKSAEDNSAAHRRLHERIDDHHETITAKVDGGLNDVRDKMHSYNRQSWIATIGGVFAAAIAVATVMLGFLTQHQNALH